MSEAAIAEEILAQTANHGERIVKLEHWKHGNGARGAEERIQILEQHKEASMLLYSDLRTHLEEHKSNRAMIKKMGWGVVAVVAGQLILVILGAAIYAATHGMLP